MTAPASCDLGHRASVFLEQGEIRATAHPEIISTILGSCVAVCLYDPVARIAGMNHFLLADSRGREPSARYGDVAVERLLAAMAEVGAKRSQLVAKVFGGGAVLPLAGAQAYIGSDNVDIAVRELHRLDIPVVAHCTGGCQGLVIRLVTDTGDVFVKRLGNMRIVHNTVLIQE